MGRRPASGRWQVGAVCGVLIASILCCPLPAGAAEGITVLSPGQTHFVGQPLLFHIQTRELVPPVKATVLYRTTGVLSFRRLSMTGETPLDFTALLDASRAAPPGIEYFFSIEDGKGDVYTFPAENPRQDPYRLEISLDVHPPTVTDHSPPHAGTAPHPKPTIKATYRDEESGIHAESVRILLNGIDVTQLAEVSAEGLLFTPSQELPYGDHTVTLDLADVNGNRMPTRSWTFSVAETKRFKEATGELNIRGEAKALISSKKDSAAPDWTFQSNIGLNTRVETGSYKASLTASMYYQEEEGPGPQGDSFNLTNYLLKVEKGKTTFSLGDVTARGSELLSSSIARRGTLLVVKTERTSTEVFALRSNAVTGFDHVLGFDDPDQLLAGASVERSMDRDGGWRVRIAALSGRNEDPDDYNASTLQPGTEGRAYSLGVVGRMGKGRITLTGEIAGSTYDKDLADGEDEESDTALMARLSGSGGPFTWGGSYRLLGENFRSIANPTGASDREEITVNGSYRAGSSNFALTLGTNHDNVDDDPSRAVISNDTGSLNYTFAKAQWPTLFFNQTLVKQESADEPVGYTPLENETYTAVLGGSYGRPTWNLAPVFTVTLFDDQAGVVENDSSTRVFNLAGSFRPWPSVSLSPTLSLTRLHSEATGLTTETTQGALAGRFNLKGDRVTLHTTLSHLGSKLDDGSSDTTTLSGTLQLNWKFLSAHDETFSLRGQYTNTENKVADTETEDYTIYAVFSFGIPVTLF